MDFDNSSFKISNMGIMRLCSHGSPSVGPRLAAAMAATAKAAAAAARAATVAAVAAAAAADLLSALCY